MVAVCHTGVFLIDWYNFATEKPSVWMVIADTDGQAMAY
jgi:hypothetical protein